MGVPLQGYAREPLPSYPLCAGAQSLWARRQRHPPCARDRAPAGGHHPHQRIPGQDGSAG